MPPNLRGDRIIQLRKERGLTQYDLADLLDISQNQISRYERNAINPGIDTLVKLAECFDTTTDYLLGRSNIPHPGAEPDPLPDLTPTEIEVLELLRTYAAEDQKRLLSILETVSEIRRDD